MSISGQLHLFGHFVIRPSYAKIFYSAPYSQTSWTHVPPSMWGTKFHTHKKTGKIIVLYIVILKFLDGKLEDKRFCTEW